MDNTCPNCGKKLSIFYLKPDCPNCGVNILYYDMENRLEQDAKKAEEEYARLENFLYKITPKFIKRKKEQKNENN